MICAQCGNNIDDNIKFCCYCGSKIDIEQNAIYLAKNNYTQQEEVEIIKYCRDLTATIEIEEKQLKKIQAETYKKRPNPPVKQISVPEPKYPNPPVARLKYFKFSMIYWCVIGLALIILVISSICADDGSAMEGFWIAWYFGLLCTFPFTFVFWRKKIRKMNAILANSPEYLQARQRAASYANEQARNKQNEYDKKYEEQMEHYQNVIIKQYDIELKSWTIFKEKKIGVLMEEIALNKSALHKVYECTKLVSSMYRDLYTLMWLYEDMSTSNHDIRYATELYDRDRQRAVTEAAGLAVRQSVYDLEETMRVGFDAVYDAIEYGNTLTEKEVSVLSKTRRDQNIANIIGIGQMHKQNKMLDKLID